MYHYLMEEESNPQEENSENNESETETPQQQEPRSVPGKIRTAIIRRACCRRGR